MPRPLERPPELQQIAFGTRQQRLQPRASLHEGLMSSTIGRVGPQALGSSGGSLISATFASSRLCDSRPNRSVQGFASFHEHTPCAMNLWAFTMRAISALVIACAIAMPAFAQTQKQIPTPTIVGIKAGETLQLYTFSAVTRSCAVLYKGFDAVDVLDGDPDLSVEYWEKRVEFTTASGKRCENVPGVVFLLTASKDITEEKESNLTIRLRYQTRRGSFPFTLRYYVLMYPASEEASNITPIRRQESEPFLPASLKRSSSVVSRHSSLRLSVGELPLGHLFLRSFD